MTDLKYFKRKTIEEELGKKVLQIKTDDIRPNRAQPRAEFDQNSIIRLADSIRRYGILQPLTVRLTDPDDIYGYELIAGERRLRAAKMLGYLTVPCVLMEVDEQISAELAIIENLLREDLNMFEQAYGFRKLIETYRLTQEEVARRMSLSQSAVANKLRLLRLPYEDQQYILEKGLTERHARASLRIDHPQKRSAAIHYIAENKLNVQATEQYIEDLLTERSSKEHKVKDPNAPIVIAESEPTVNEREMLEMVDTLRKRIDRWNKNGRCATMSVTSSPKSTEISIRIVK